MERSDSYEAEDDVETQEELSKAANSEYRRLIERLKKQEADEKKKDDV